MMTPRLVWTTALVLMASTGCPHTYGIGGTIDRSMLKDMIENASQKGCPVSELQELCGDDDFEWCVKNCLSRARGTSRP